VRAHEAGPYQVVRLGGDRKELYGVYELSRADKLALRTGWVELLQ
jgi:hypothetical protein